MLRWRARSIIAGREIDADAVRRLERGQQIALAAAELEHPQARRHEEPVHVLEAAVIGARQAAAALAASGAATTSQCATRRGAVGVGIPTV